MTSTVHARNAGDARGIHQWHHEMQGRSSSNRTSRDALGDLLGINHLQMIQIWNVKGQTVASHDSAVFWFPPLVRETSRCNRSEMRDWLSWSWKMEADAKKLPRTDPWIHALRATRNCEFWIGKSPSSSISCWEAPAGRMLKSFVVHWYDSG
jgi:hypothetical protein